MRKAAGVILVRGDQVYLAQRSPDSSFFPGFHAFFGGAVEGDETLPECALRELFEEAGIWLGSAPSPESRRALLEGGRPALGAGDTAALVPAGVRTTPVYSRVRFEAQFYLLETDQEPDIWPGELSGGGWWPFVEAVQAWERGEILLAPPTLEAVRALAEHGRAAAAVLQATEFPYEDWLPLSPGLHYLPLETATLPPARHTLCVLLGGARRLLVDPSGPVPLNHVSEVVFTHHHPDHVGGGAWARDQGLPLAAHAETASRLPFPVDRMLEDGHVWELGLDGAGLPWTVEALHTPGHAPGHLALWNPERRFLVAGDLVSGLSTILIHPPDGDMEAYLSSLERMAALEPRLVVASHGPPFGPGSRVFEKVLAHRRARESRVLAALGSPLPLEDLVTTVYADTPQADPRLAALALEAHLLKLEAEGRALRSAAGWAAAAPPGETAPAPPGRAGG